MTITTTDMVDLFEQAAAKFEQLTAKLDMIGLEAGRELLAGIRADERASSDFTDGERDGACGDGVHARLSERPERADRRLYLAGYAFGWDGACFPSPSRRISATSDSV
jgi:hypothetical protein